MGLNGPKGNDPKGLALSILKPLLSRCSYPHIAGRTAVEGPMFEKGEIPVIIFGVLFAMLFVLGTNTPPTGIYSEQRNHTDTLQRAEDNK
jgi:hypothetical protein